MLHVRIDELTQAIALGDAEALTQFYRNWFDWMYDAAQSFTHRDEAFCLDVVHDAMLRVIRSIRKMDTREDLERWLRTVVKRAAIDRMRRDSRQAAREQAVADERGEQPAMQHATEEREWLTRALRMLDPRDQELIMARHKLELTFAEIGKARDQSAGAMHSKLGRILATLKRHAKEAFDVS